MTYSQANPWTVAETKVGCSLITFLHMETQAQAEKYASQINAFSGQAAYVMTTEKARQLKLSRVYVN